MTVHQLKYTLELNKKYYTFIWFQLIYCFIIDNNFKLKTIISLRQVILVAYKYTELFE